MKFNLVIDENFEPIFEDINIETLTESSLNRIINGHDANGYVMISASRYDALEKENPNWQEVWDENNKRTDAMKKEIRNAHYSYIPVYGGYKDKNSDKATVEKSFIVFPYDNINDKYIDFDIFEKDMLKMGRNYNQNSILIKRPNENPFYFYYEDNSSDKPFDNVSVNDIQKQYFTALKSYKDISMNKNNNKNWNSSPQRFTYEYTESFINHAPQNIMEAHARSSKGELLDMSKFNR